MLPTAASWASSGVSPTAGLALGADQASPGQSSDVKPYALTSAIS